MYNKNRNSCRISTQKMLKLIMNPLKNSYNEISLSQIHLLYLFNFTITLYNLALYHENISLYYSFKKEYLIQPEPQPDKSRKANGGQWNFPRSATPYSRLGGDTQRLQPRGKNPGRSQGGRGGSYLRPGVIGASRDKRRGKGAAFRSADKAQPLDDLIGFSARESTLAAAVRLPRDSSVPKRFCAVVRATS